MSDEIDLAQEREHIATNSALDQVREKAARIDLGTAKDEGAQDECAGNRGRNAARRVR